MTIKDFKLEAHNLNGLIEIFKMMLTNGSIRVSAVKWQDRRSLSQNALSHMWYKVISDFLISKGRKHCTEKWVKGAMKHTFLGYEYITKTNVLTGETITIEELKHTSNLDKGEMLHFLNQVEQWSLNIGCALPIPENCEYAQLNNLQDN